MLYLLIPLTNALCQGKVRLGESGENGQEPVPSAHVLPSESIDKANKASQHNKYSMSDGNKGSGGNLKK